MYIIKIAILDSGRNMLKLKHATSFSLKNMNKKISIEKILITMKNFFFLHIIFTQAQRKR